MEKVYVNVDYQVLVGGAIKPVRIYWHDGRAFDIRKTLHCCTSEDEYEGIRYTVLIGSAENIYTESAANGMLSRFRRRWILLEKLYLIRRA